MSARLFKAALIASCAIYIAPSIAAQNYTPESGDEIIVTATKFSSNVDELGLSVSVLDGESLNRLDSAEEITQYLSGVQAAVANGTQTVFQIRGIGAVDHQALTPTAAAVYVDGVFQATNVQTGPLLFDLERTEVLKGPQGSLYGRNASAGAINFISKRPTDENEGYAAVEVGNFDRFNLNAASNLVVNEDVSLRLAGRYLTQGPTLDNVVTVPGIEAPEEAGGERDEFGLRAIGRYAPNNNTEVLLNVHYAEDNGVNPGPRNEGLDLGRHEISVGPDGIDDTDNEFYGANLQLKHDFGKFELFSLTAFESYNQQYGFSFGGLQDFSARVASLSGTANLDYDRDFTQFSQEFRLSRNTERYSSLVGVYLEAENFEQEYLVSCGELNRETLVGSCNYIVANPRLGVNERRVERDLNGDPILVPALDEDDQPRRDEDGNIILEEIQIEAANTLQSLIEQERKTAAIFTYNQYKLSPELELILGGRLTFENIEGSGEGRFIFASDGFVGINDRNDIGPAVGSNEINDTQFSYNLGLNYSPADDLLFYASYATGYKSGGFNGEVIDNAAHFDDAGLFEAETVDTVEIGVKFNREKLSVNVAGFYNDYNDPQARFFENVTLENGETVGLNTLSNFDAARSTGVEASFTYAAFDGFEVGGGATWLDTEIDDPDQPSLSGDELPFASEFSGTLNVAYRWALSEQIEARIAANGKYQSEFLLGANLTNSDGSNFTQSGYETIDARGELILGNGVELGVWGRNLSNSDYTTSAFSFFGPTTFRANPRQYGVSLKFSY